MDSSSKQRLVENEVIFRAANQDVQEFISETHSDTVLLGFYCECSHMGCHERIEMSASDYKKSHANKRQFIALKGHEKAEIEKIVHAEPGFNVIEKYDDPPDDEAIHAALKNILSE